MAFNLISNLLTTAAPFSVYDAAAINQLIDNINVVEDRVYYQNSSSAAIATAGTSASPGTWYVIASYVLAHTGLPSIFTATFPVIYNAVGANVHEFGLFKAGTQVGWAARNNAEATTYSANINLAFFLPVSTGSVTWELRARMVNGAPAVTASLPAGYRITHFEV